MPACIGGQTARHSSHTLLAVGPPIRSRGVGLSSQQDLESSAGSRPSAPAARPHNPPGRGRLACWSPSPSDSAHPASRPGRTPWAIPISSFLGQGRGVRWTTQGSRGPIAGRDSHGRPGSANRTGPGFSPTTLRRTAQPPAPPPSPPAIWTQVESPPSGRDGRRSSQLRPSNYRPP